MEASNAVIKNESIDLNQSLGLEEFRDIEIKHRQSVVDSLVANFEELGQSYCHGLTCGCHGGNHQGKPPR